MLFKDKPKSDIRRLAGNYKIFIEIRPHWKNKVEGFFKGCRRGTRKDVIGGIEDWLTSEQGQVFSG